MPAPPAPTGLPVEDRVAAVRDALAVVGAAVLQAEPGAGKTTVVPLRLLDEPWLDGGRIVMLEPRRLAARAAARRMATLLGEEVGATVGYRTRDDRKVGRATRIEVVTEGILTQQIQRDPSLPGVGLVILDEFHERSLNADLALALLLDARPALRPDLRLLVMSATLDAAAVAAHLEPGAAAPVITSTGRARPVTIRWSPVGGRTPLAEATAATVRRALRDEPGDVLVFLPGAADIRRVATELGRPGARPPEVDIRPLFGALGADEQDAALRPSPVGRRRVVLATDIAETSLTVDGVRIVVDSGLARSPRHDRRRGLTHLHTGPISRASADQRAGRAGRTAPGVAYRLWAEADHLRRAAFTDPEIRHADLAGLALELARWGAAAADLRFVDPPPGVALDHAHDLLRDLGALDDDHRLTARGRAMADLPLHPRLAAMVVQATATGQLGVACDLAAILEDRDVLRGRPDELPTDLTERLALLADRRGEHPRADPAAVRAARRRSDDLRRRATRTDPARADPAHLPETAPSRGRMDVGRLLAVAYPDRLAQARGGGRFRLRSGAGAVLPPTDALATAAYLVVADLDAPRDSRDGPDGRIRLALGLDRADAEQILAPAVTIERDLVWDPDRDDLRVTETRRVDALVLDQTVRRAEPSPATTAALLDRVRITDLAVLRWTAAARTLQARATFVGGATRDWPRLDDAALIADLGDWLAPRLGGATGRADLERLDVLAALRDRLGHHRVAELDLLAPARITVASGRAVPVDYEGERPAIAVRAQDLYGTTEHPTIARGRVPVVVTVLSPAGRPVQVTADLPGFWAGSWAEVRKDMAGRYPKHDWPADPAAATPSSRPRRAR